MASFRQGKVTALGPRGDDLIEARVGLVSGEIDAVGFPSMLGDLSIGDAVIVNTTGIELGLGTGGVGFLLWNLDGRHEQGVDEGHIVKLRYTPWQTEVLAAEAPESPHHDALAAAEAIDGMPVVACGLHSQIAGVAAGIKATSPEAKVGFLMTDGGALPLAWTRLAKELSDRALIDVTCTAGHAFGGELESVNVFSGLAALRHVGNVDVAIVAMGPGVVGTATTLGTTALEQGQVLDAVTSLDGTAVACLRISFHDARDRHRGVSHHSLTALRIAARERAIIAVPKLPDHQAREVNDQLESAGLTKRHDIVIEDGEPGLRLLEDRGVRPTSMGRSIEDAPEGFLAAAAAGAIAASHAGAVR